MTRSAAAHALAPSAAVTEAQDAAARRAREGCRSPSAFPTAARAAHSTDALLQSLVDFVALQLAEKGIAGENWVMAERGPGGLKLKFSADATADCDEAKQTFQASGISGARLTVSKA